MKKTGKHVFFITLLLIAAVTTLSFTGLYWQYGDVTTPIIKGANEIRWGIDIRGGVDVTFSPPEGYDATNDEMSAAESIIKTRLVSQNITDYELYADFDRDRLILRFPWKSDEVDFNPERAIQELGEMAMLTFREGDEMDAYRHPTGVTAETVILEGRHVRSATAQYGQLSETGQPEYFVELALTGEGQQLFSEATARLVGSVISIWMDDNLISAPVVNTQINEATCIITGQFDAAAAKELADKINGGALPFKLVTENYSTISPSLGIKAKDAMVVAGLIAYICTAAFMIFLYRVPGVIAAIGLAGQVGLMIAAITGFFPFTPSFTLTLPGIAGIILSIGMGVDSNVIIDERIKEELKNGKTLDGAVAAGFTRAFSAIFDGNITVIIVAAILMGAFGPPGNAFGVLLKPFFFMFGPATTGTIYSFGYTLLMGVLANFVMGIFFCRIMHRSIIRFKFMRKPWLFGGDKA